jgi:hypothetical protein
MDALNRIKVVLVEQKRQGNGCLNSWGLMLPQQAVGARM